MARWSSALVLPLLLPTVGFSLRAPCPPRRCPIINPWLSCGKTGGSSSLRRSRTACLTTARPRSRVGDAGEPSRARTRLALCAGERDESRGSGQVSRAVDAARLVRPEERSRGLRAAPVPASTGLRHQLHHRQTRTRPPDQRVFLRAGAARQEVRSAGIFFAS